MRHFWLCALILQTLPLTALSATLTVRPDGTGDFPTIQAAVNASINGDIITLADGTFAGVGNRSVNYLGKAITIRSANGPNSTTINCGGADGFLFVSNEPSAAVLRDVTIQSTNVALICRSGTPTIRNVAVTTSWIGIQVGAYAWDNEPAAVPTVDSTTISSCHLGTTTRDTGHLKLLHSTVSQCNTVHSGTGGFISASDCTFSSNASGVTFSAWAGTGGTFVGCRFVDHAYNAISAAGGVGPVTLTNCEFVRNKAAVFCEQNGIKIERCIFLDNDPAIFADWGLEVLEVYESVFCGNTFAITSSMKVALIGNTLVRNSPKFGSGSIGLSSPDVTGPIERNIIAFSLQGPGISCTNGASPTLSCNDVFGNAGGDVLCGVVGSNNISLDPLICSPGCGAFALAADSPCAPANNACGVRIGAAEVECGPLPVLFSSFTATTTYGVVRLVWSLEADEDIARFTVLRRVGDRSVAVVSDLPRATRTFADASARPGETYLYTIVATTLDDDVFRSQAVTVDLPRLELVLFQNRPNPFNPSTEISYTLPEPSEVVINVVDVSGRHVVTLVNGLRPAGFSSVVWNGQDEGGNAVGSGVYFCRLSANGNTVTKKMLLLK